MIDKRTIHTIYAETGDVFTRCNVCHGERQGIGLSRVLLRCDFMLAQE